MKKKLEAYSETLYHLINFRIEQFQQSKSIIGIDYDSFMILSVMGSHYIKNNNKLGSDWDDVWEVLRSSKIEEFYTSKKLTIFAVANILNLPRETVRRKIDLLKKRKLINHSTKQGLLPTNKTEEIMKPFATKEIKSLSKFLQSLKKNKSSDKSDNNKLKDRVEILENNFKNIDSEKKIKSLEKDVDELKSQVKNLVEIIESIFKF